MATAASSSSSLAAAAGAVVRPGPGPARGGGAAAWAAISMRKMQMQRGGRVRAVGEVAAEGNTYLIAGAVAVALLGTAFPILFARKDTCPECDGAGFIRKGAGGGALRANAARKDVAQIVCPNCNGLGKLGQIDK